MRAVICCLGPGHRPERTCSEILGVRATCSYRWRSALLRPACSRPLKDDPGQEYSTCKRKNRFDGNVPDRPDGRIHQPGLVVHEMKRLGENLADDERNGNSDRE